MPPPVRPGRSPRGGSGEVLRRLIRFHLPLAVASTAALILFMTLPVFDPLSYAQMDMGGPAALPRQSTPMEMGASPSPQRGGVGAMDHGAGSSAPPADHGGSGTSSSTAHGGSAPPASGHASGPTPAGGHGADPVGQTATGGMTDARARVRLDQRLTVATGYVATGLLALTLLIGPLNLLLRRRTPVSSYLRRDAGMWTGAFSVVHVIVGLQVHSGGQISGALGYFFARDGSLLRNSFGIANWLGLVATVIVVGLLTISTDLALRALKAPTWKWLQRLNYALFALVVAHAIFYGALLRVSSPFTLLLGLSVVAVLAGQALGVRLWRRRSARRAPMAA